MSERGAERRDNSLLAKWFRPINPGVTVVSGCTFTGHPNGQLPAAWKVETQDGALICITQDQPDMASANYYNQKVTPLYESHLSFGYQNGESR